MDNPQILYSWKAPLRPYKKRGKLIIRFFLAVAFLLSVIVAFFNDLVLLIPIWSVIFLFYVLTVTPPPEVENKITVFGVETAGITLRWETLSHFYFYKRFGFEVLTLVSQPPLTYYAYLVIPDEATKKKIFDILIERLQYQEKVRKSFLEKIIDKLSELVPDDEQEVGLNENEKPLAASPLSQTVFPNK